MTDYFSRTEKACKRKFMEIGGGEEIIEIEMVKKRKMEQEKARMGEKMTTNERSDENDEKSPYNSKQSESGRSELNTK